MVGAMATSVYRLLFRQSMKPWVVRTGSWRWVSSPSFSTSVQRDTTTETELPVVTTSALEPDEGGEDALTPAKVVEMLDRYIVGQREAKRAVAVALRMRSQPLV